MGEFGLLFSLKIISLIAAIAQTAGFVGFFAFEALAPYKWQLLAGGTVAIVMSEGLSYWLARRMAADTNGSSDAR